MKPITINLRGKFIDGYIYLGRLFLVGMDGNVSSISMDELVGQIKDKDIFNILKIAFLRNDWVNNLQGKGFFQLHYQTANFKKVWSKTAEFDFHINVNQVKEVEHFCVPDAPVFDIKL